MWYALLVWHNEIKHYKNEDKKVDKTTPVYYVCDVITK